MTDALSGAGEAAGPTVEAAKGARAESVFAHASEAEFARILDFYQVSWEYEPHVFAILWDLDGNVLESFAPDFYLPELDTFVELTTLQQRLVRKKNRKVRRLRELYPGLRIKLFYARDFRALMLKYGRAALVSELSGTMGQFPASGSPGHPEDADEESDTGGNAATRYPAVEQNQVETTDREPASDLPESQPARPSRASRRRVRRAAARNSSPSSVT